MPIDDLAARYLEAFSKGLEFPGGLSFRTALTQSRLDFSRESLSRVDRLLDQVRARFQPRHGEFVDAHANQNFMYLLGFYVGAVVSRCSGRDIRWYEYDEMIKVMPGNAALFPRCFATSITCILSGDVFFVPLSAIEEKLFDAAPTATVASSAGKYIELRPTNPPIPRPRARPAGQAYGPQSAKLRSTAELLGFLTAYAVWLVAEGAPLAPILSAGDGVIRQLAIDDAVAVGKDELDANPEAAAQLGFVYDAFITLDTGRTDALIAEARRYGDEPFHLAIALPYRSASSRDGFEVHTPRLLTCDADETEWMSIFEAFYAGVDKFKQPRVVWPKEGDEGDKPPAVKSINQLARSYVHGFLGSAKFADGSAFESDLRVLRLDFSLGSVDRIDALIDRLRQDERPDEAQFMPVVANQNFVYLLAYYLGETIARQTDATINWYSVEAAVEQSEDIRTLRPAFYASAVCRFDCSSRGCAVELQPLETFVTRLFDGESKRARSVADETIGRIVGTPPTLAIDPTACFKSLRQDEMPYAWIPAPAWIERDDLKKAFYRYRDLWFGGRVVWGRIVQANTDLFAEGEADLPGEVIYDPGGTLRHVDLIEPARALLALKGTRPADRALRDFAEYFEAGSLRAMGKQVPESITPHRLLVSSILFHRRHLPDGKLSLSYFPVLVNDKYPGVVMVLPSRWWPDELTGRWVFRAA